MTVQTATNIRNGREYTVVRDTIPSVEKIVSVSKADGTVTVENGDTLTIDNVYNKSAYDEVSKLISEQIVKVTQQLAEQHVEQPDAEEEQPDAEEEQPAAQQVTPKKKAARTNTKMAAAREIFLRDPARARKDIIADFMIELGISHPHASTYHHTIKKSIAQQ